MQITLAAITHKKYIIGNNKTAKLIFYLAEHCKVQGWVSMGPTTAPRWRAELIKS